MSAARVRHCSYCHEAAHTRKTCPALQAATAARLFDLAEAKRQKEEALREAKEKERADFAAMPTQTQLLSLFDMIKTLEATVSRASEEFDRNIERVREETRRQYEDSY